MYVSSIKDAKSFYNGLVEDITDHPNKYPKQARKNPGEYAAVDIYLALNMHFNEAKTHRLWNKALPKNY
ncbi:MAG: hypothetical protein ISS23_03405 [Nanoarchaeota archaeon]|nr:hypothetical protein [Nanoarchaeota archaeon]